MSAGQPEGSFTPLQLMTLELRSAVSDRVVDPHVRHFRVRVLRYVS